MILKKNETLVEIQSKQLAEDFALNVRLLRLSKGLDQGQAADRVGMHRIRWNEIEKSKHMPSWTTIIKVAISLNIAPHELVNPELHKRLTKQGVRDRMHVRYD